MAHSERQNEYFIEKDGISREVIQADICRYLGNDALVKPGVHQGRQGYFIRAYRNLTSEMIADLKADSARWEAETSRRAERGHPRGNYYDDANLSQGPNGVPASYNSSAIHESRQQATYAPATTQPYMDVYASAPSAYPPQASGPGYGQSFNQPSGYSSDPAPYPPAPTQYAQGQSSMPVVTTAEMQSSYTYAPGNPGNPYPYADSRAAPRYTGQGYENDGPDYAPVPTTGMGYPPTTAPDPRMMDPRYSPESVYPDPRGPVSRPMQARERDPQRRPR
ncbi:RfeG, putative [Coccidioides posadasii C735 delta SOWgp]|nr:RfeG, putative [Coccidioides posadasii C735 delta SOWgp]EER27824.1 RfeG, putative [Coccidioides posadasii C735 delta SOWgp]|eukprot:XP_003069969.1 RfeG, putative [Coccidioides posadasii C735 delta SOWgp]